MRNNRFKEDWDRAGRQVVSHSFDDLQLRAGNALRRFPRRFRTDDWIFAAVNYQGRRTDCPECYPTIRRGKNGEHVSGRTVRRISTTHGFRHQATESLGVRLKT